MTQKTKYPFLYYETDASADCLPKNEIFSELYEKAFFGKEDKSSSEYALNTTTWD